MRIHVRRHVEWAWVLLVLALVLAAMLIARPAHSAFEDLEVSPQARALGGAWAAALDDPYAAFHNPASLAWTTRTGAQASWLRPFGYDFATQTAAAAVLPLPTWGGVGVGVRRFGVDWQGENLMHETTVAVSHGMRILDDAQTQLALGWTLNLYALDYGRSVSGLDPGNAVSLGVSLGAIATVRERTRVGIQVMDVNNPDIGSRDKEQLPRAVTVGVRYAPYPGVETALDLSNTLGRDVQYRGGVAVGLTEFASLYAGVITAPSQLTAGLSLGRGGMSLDYGFTSGGVLPVTHHVGVGVRLHGAR
jgi:hypothetical protein